MADHSAIEWTDATWNPVRGCSIVSKGCTNCYAMKQAHRFSGPGGSYEGLTKLTNGGPVWTGAVRLVPELLDQPLRWTKPRRIFVNSMSDLFHEDVPDEFIDQVFAVITRARDHVFQVLTKRPARMLDYMAASRRSERVFVAGHNTPLCALSAPAPWPPANAWLGVSVEDQAAADARIPLLLQTPAAVRWISAEPLLGPVDLLIEKIPGHRVARALSSGKGDACLHWVVAGGESGPGARPAHPDWIRILRDQCAGAGVPFFFKQWGSHRIGEYEPKGAVAIHWQDGATEFYGDHQDIKYSTSWFHPSDGGMPVIAWPTSKAKAGRLLDGRTHDEFPR